MKAKDYFKLAFILELFSLVILAYSQKAKIETGEMYIETEKRNRYAEVEQLPDGTEIPQGYFVITRGEFKTGPATIKCGERYMIEKTKEKARQVGADAFRFYDIKEPDNVFNTCFKAKIMFFLKR